MVDKKKLFIRYSSLFSQNYFRENCKKGKVYFLKHVQK